MLGNYINISSFDIFEVSLNALLEKQTQEKCLALVSVHKI